MKGWAAYHGQQPLAFYVAGDGNVIMGTLMDSEGEDMTSKPLQAAVRAAMMDGIWKRVEKSHWVAEGSPSAPARSMYSPIRIGPTALSSGRRPSPGSRRAKCRFAISWSGY